MNNNPFRKRIDPFAQPINPVKEVEQEQPKEEVKVEEPEKIEEIKVEKEVVKVKKEVKKTSKKFDPDDKSREKYTATMLISLRRKIKIYCATKGTMFSEFIEEACLEKLKREGE